MGLFGSTSITFKEAYGVSQNLTRWAFLFGASFLPAYPIYGLFFDDNIPGGLWGRLLHMIILLPDHLGSTWYLSANFAGLFATAFLLYRYWKKMIPLSKAIFQYWHKDELFQGSVLLFVVLSLGFYVVPVFAYGGSFAIGLLATSWVGIWIWLKFLEVPKTQRFVHFILVFTLIENLLLAWLVLPIMHHGVENRSGLIFRTYFYDNGPELAMKKTLVYLYDLVPIHPYMALLTGLFLQGLLMTIVWNKRSKGLFS